MLQHFGRLKGSDQSFVYKGTSRGGYRKKPGAGLNAGILRPQFELKELLDSEFWEIGLFNDMYLYWQTSLMQPEGGMDKIPKAFLNHQLTTTEEPPKYLAINQPQGRLVLAGDYLSFISGWMEGAVRSAELTVERIAHLAIS